MWQASFRKVNHFHKPASFGGLWQGLALANHERMSFWQRLLTLILWQETGGK